MLESKYFRRFFKLNNSFIHSFIQLLSPRIFVDKLEHLIASEKTNLSAIIIECGNPCSLLPLLKRGGGGGELNYKMVAMDAF